MRIEIAQVSQYARGNRSRRVKKAVETMIQGKDTVITEVLDTLKQRLAVYATRLRRYRESHDRKQQNYLFNTNQKKFYQSLNSQENIETTTPNIADIEKFWSDTWTQTMHYNSQALWLEKEKDRYNTLKQQTDSTVTEEDLRRVIQRTHNWKQPGTDNVQNFWYKKFTSIYSKLADHINYIIEHPEKQPKFLTEGKTYIKPKNSETQNPANYRPITCLQTIYKIITSIITEKIDNHLTMNNVLTEEQKGCSRRSRGCKEQLVIDSVVMKQAERQQRNLHACYIDYKKAYDYVPHDWLNMVLEIYKIDNKLQKFLSHSMTLWRTSIHLSSNKGHAVTNQIKINRGIFQGDSLSALWFCMCLNPLSNTLNNTNYGFKIKGRGNTEHRVSHLLYMDDIKLYAQTLPQIRSLIQITEDVSRDIGMEFGISKCKILHMEKGRWTDSVQTETLNNEIIEHMQPHETYKYLGFQQSTRLDHTLIKKQLGEKYKHRLTDILKSRLNSGNLTKAVNAYAIPIITYSFGIIRWTRTDLEAINRLNRSEMTKYRKHHPKSCVERVTIKRSDGGRGILDVTLLYQRQIKDLREYFHSKDTPLHKTIVKADLNYTPLNLAGSMECPAESYTQKIERWANKVIHGKHPAVMQNEYISKDLSYRWLQRGYLFPETEGLLLSIQDQVVATRNYRRYIIKDPQITDDRCRKCHLYQETIDHITGGCKLLAATEYTDRHNNVAKIIHNALLRKYKMHQGDIPYYRYNPESVTENEVAKIYWDRTIHTDKTIPHNRPDITLINKITRHTYLIDVAVPNDTNIEHKTQEKKDKYLPLAVEIKELWRQNQVSVIPVIISVTGITPHSLTESLDVLGITDSVHTTIQKAVILNTCATVRKFLQQ